jgi:anthranilate phosphoribosyltransferase
MIKEAIARLVERHSLSAEEAEVVMEEIMRGEATPVQIAAYLMALRLKGETVAEIVGSARAMKAHALGLSFPPGMNLVDTCGTGGDALGTFNISTVAALVVAGAGVPVAKHGNRAASSRCGSADLLEALGASVDLGPQEVARCIEEVGIGFLFAQRFHPAMKHAGPVRRELGVRTIFNIIGPLVNPASPSCQLLGVFSPRLTATLARVLGLLGVRRALVVHGADGLDELSTTGPNRVSELGGKHIRTYTLDTQELGLPRARLQDFLGGSVEDNCRITLALLEGEKGPRRDVVLLNAAAGLYVAGKARDLKEGLALAARTIDSRAARRKLEELVAFSRGLGK